MVQQSCGISELPEAGRDYAFQDGGRGVRGGHETGEKEQTILRLVLGPLRC